MAVLFHLLQPTVPAVKIRRAGGLGIPAVDLLAMIDKFAGRNKGVVVDGILIANPEAA